MAIATSRTATHKASRFERRSLARQRRIQQRLERGPRRGAHRRTLSRPARILIFVASLLVGLGVARVVTATAVSWWTDEPATIDALAVQGTVRLSVDEVARSLGVEEPLSLQDVDPESLARRAMEHPWIRDARVAVLPTGTVIVDVSERRPRAVLRDAADALHFVDTEGLAFAPVVADDRVGGLSALATAAGETPSPERLAEAIGLLDRLEGLALRGLARPKEAHRGLELVLPASGEDGEESGSWVLRRRDGSAAVLLGSGELASLNDRLERLEQLLGAGLPELAGVDSIDLRFAGQAVLRKQGASR